MLPSKAVRSAGNAGTAHCSCTDPRRPQRGLPHSHGYEPSGQGWLLARHVRAQRKRAAILLDQLLYSEISSVSICFISAVFDFCWVEGDRSFYILY